MKDQKSEVENVIKSLIDFEKHLDEIKEISIERKENLIKITETEVEKIKNTDIVEELTLPPVKIHCSVLAEDAIKTAIQDYKSKNPET